MALKFRKLRLLLGSALRPRVPASGASDGRYRERYRIRSTGQCGGGRQSDADQHGAGSGTLVETNKSGD